MHKGYRAKIATWSPTADIVFTNMAPREEIREPKVQLSHREKDGSEAGELIGDEVLRALRGHAVPAIMLMRLCKAVAPISAAALLFKLISYLGGHHKHFLIHPKSRLTTLLNLYMLSETLFGIYCAHMRAKGQKFYVDGETSKEERLKLFKQCLATVASPRIFASSWFRNADITQARRGNVEDWLAWGYFNRPFLTLTPDQQEEVQGFVDEVERATNVKLPKGHNGLMRTFKFSLEPVESAHRPLAYYAIVHGLVQRVLAPLGYLSLGFGSLIRAGPFNYYIRRATKPRCDQAPPVVLIHGIGVGPLPYVPFVKELLQCFDETRDFIVVELPAVSQQVAPPQLTSELFVMSMRELFAKEGLPPARFIGHSYGTMCMAWIVKSAPDLAESYAFLDPGCFLLHHTKALKAIIYKEALSEGEKLFEYFLRSELFFSNHMRRHFVWFKNVLFFDDIPTHQPTLILLSEHDDIMPVKEILETYEAHPERQSLKHISFVKLPKTKHGAFLFESTREQVVSAVTSIGISQNPI